MRHENVQQTHMKIHKYVALNDNIEFRHSARV